jgi:DNA-binding MarR family transcriptional regulator
MSLLTKPQWLTLEEAADEIRMSRRAFRRLIADRKIAVSEVNSRVKRVERRELERFMRSRETERIGDFEVRRNGTV